MKLKVRTFSVTLVYTWSYPYSQQQRPQCSPREEIWWCFVKKLHQFQWFIFFSFRGQIMTSSFLNLTYWRPHALFSALHLLKIAQWGALQNMWVPERYQLGPKVHVRYVNARGQAITRFPSKCHAPVTACNHSITCYLLADFTAFMSWKTSLLDFFHVLLSEEDRSLPT